jgi:hypothetical protein
MKYRVVKKCNVLTGSSPYHAFQIGEIVTKLDNPLCKYPPYRYINNSDLAQYLYEEDIMEININPNIQIL